MLIARLPLGPEVIGFRDTYTDEEWKLWRRAPLWHQMEYEKFETEVLQYL